MPTGSRGSNTNPSFLMLTHATYTDWAMIMEVNLKVALLSDAIEDEDATRKEDTHALSMMFHSLPSDMH
jgi:hypothetical protein